MNHLILTSLLQFIGRVRHDKTLLTVSIIFVESKHFLPNNITSVRNSPFHDYRTAIRPHNKMQAIKIPSTLYENNFWNKKVKTSTLYYTFDLVVLWFINIIRYYRHLTLTCLMSNSFFTGQTVYGYCNNYIYNKWHEINSAIPVFKRYDIIVWHCLWYLTTIKYIQAVEIQYTTELIQY